MGAVTIVVTAFTLIMVWRTGDTSPLAYLIPAVFAETAAATGFYYSKAKAEKPDQTSEEVWSGNLQRHKGGMTPMFNSIVENLVSIGWSMLIFLSAYLANVTFSLWYNIKLLHEPFDREKLINSAYKIATFVIGLTLLCGLDHTSPVCERSRLAIPPGVHRPFR